MRREKDEKELVLEERVAKNVPKLMKDIKPHILFRINIQKSNLCTL